MPALYQPRLISPTTDEGPMSVTISSAFDAGNIRVTKQNGDSADLEIVHDHMSDVYNGSISASPAARGAR